MINLIDHQHFLEVVQVCDSTFPIGTFNHSFGMENYLREDIISDAKGYASWQDAYLNSQFKYSEALGILFTFKALGKQDSNRIMEIDQILTVSSQAKETREGTIMIAKQMLRLLLKLHPSTELENYYSNIKKGEANGHPAIVFAIFCYHKEILPEDSVCLYGYSIISTMVQNAVRTIPLGQQAGQEIVKHSIAYLYQLVQDIIDLDDHYLGITIPGIELAQIKHETQLFRLFMS